MDLPMLDCVRLFDLTGLICATSNISRAYILARRPGYGGKPIDFIPA